MAGVAALATVAVFFGGIEPRNLRPKEVVEQPGQRLGPLQALRAGSMIILKSTWTVFRIRSFQVILAAGIVGAMPQAYLDTNYHGWRQASDEAVCSCLSLEAKAQRCCVPVSPATCLGSELTVIQ